MSPHAFCLGNHANLIWVLVISHLVVSFSYMIIPTCGFMLYMRLPEDVLLSQTLKKSKEWLLIISCLFIFSCGLAHAVEANTFFEANYLLEALVMVVTATISLLTAVELIFLVFMAYRWRPSDS